MLGVISAFIFVLSTWTSGLCVFDRHRSVFSVVLVDVALLHSPLCSCCCTCFLSSLEFFFRWSNPNSTASTYTALYASLSTYQFRYNYIIFSICSKSLSLIFYSGFPTIRWTYRFLTTNQCTKNKIQFDFVNLFVFVDAVAVEASQHLNLTPRRFAHLFVRTKLLTIWWLFILLVFWLRTIEIERARERESGIFIRRLLPSHHHHFIFLDVYFVHHRKQERENS